MRTERVEVLSETFDRATPSRVDGQRDEIVRAVALETGKLSGVDNITGLATDFSVRGVGFREDVFAAESASSARQRSMVCGLSVALLGVASFPLPALAAAINAAQLRVYLAEARSPLHGALARNVRPELLTASEYFDGGLRSGDLVDGILHEDLQDLSFDDAAFDVVLTTDVLEHVPNPERAEREIARVLRPGGHYIFTVPLDLYGDADIILAERLQDGTTRFHGEPVYHGDGLRPEGILAYRIFAQADLARRFDGLGCTLRTYRFWSPAFGILGMEALVHLVRKRT
jgi:SAM-dependent methyltransferase